MDNIFLQVLQSLTGKNKDNKYTFSTVTEKKDNTSPTGYRTTIKDDTAALIDSFRFPDKNELRNRGREYMEGQNIWHSADYSGYGSNVAERPVGSSQALGFNQPEYVPFVYTNTDDPNESLKYGYIIRYAGSGDKNTVDGVTLENRDLTSEGARKFFQNIVDKGGRMRLYPDTEKSNGEGTRLWDIEKSIGRDAPTYTDSLGMTQRDWKRGWTFYKDPKIDTAFRQSYTLIDALRNANRLNRGK